MEVEWTISVYKKTVNDEGYINDKDCGNINPISNDQPPEFDLIVEEPMNFLDGQNEHNIISCSNNIENKIHDES